MHSLKTHIVAFLSLFVSISFAQQKSADTLLMEYNKCKVDTLKIDLSLKYANAIINTDPEKAIYYGKKALKSATDRADIPRERLAYEVIGRGFQYIGDIGSAMNNFHEAIKIVSKRNDKSGLASINLNIGFLYAEMGNLELAIEYYKSAIDYFSNSNEYQGLCRCYINIADALYNSNKIDKSLYYLQKAKEISQKHHDYRILYIITNFADAYFRKKEFDLAKDYANQGIFKAKKLDNFHLLSRNYLILSRVYLANNDLKNAEKFARIGLQIAKLTAIKKVLLESYSILYQVLEKENKYKEGSIYKTLLLNTKDSNQSYINNNLLQAFEFEKKDQEIIMMKAEGIQKNAELTHQKILSTIIFLTLLLVLCITGYIYYSSKKLRKTTLELKNAYLEISNKQHEIVLQNKELLEYNERVIAQSNRIEELNDIKDRLFAIISHDLRRPFGNLKSTLKLLVAGKLSEEKLQTIVPILIKSVSTVSDLLDNLLQWSNSQLKGEMIEKKEFDISELAKKQIDLFETQASEKQIIIENKIPINTIVFADMNMTDIIIRNLVSNAIKFCNESGKIIVNAKHQENIIEISVQDEGVGISEVNLEKIFQEKGKFTTLGTKKEQGTGIGLMLCKTFVEKQNGRIGVESKENQGSRFWFSLPSRSN